MFPYLTMWEHFFMTEANQPKFFGRRKGRVIRKAKSTLLERFLPKIKIDENTVFNKQTLFGNRFRRWGAFGGAG